MDTQHGLGSQARGHTKSITNMAHWFKARNSDSIFFFRVFYARIYSA